MGLSVSAKCGSMVKRQRDIGIYMITWKAQVPLNTDRPHKVQRFNPNRVISGVSLNPD